MLFLWSDMDRALPRRGGGGGGGCHVACLNFKRSRVGALSMFHVAVTVAVGNLKKGCRLSPFHFKCCRYFLGHVACRNLPWQSLVDICKNANCTGENESKNAKFVFSYYRLNLLFQGQISLVLRLRKENNYSSFKLKWSHTGQQTVHRKRRIT